MGISIFYYSIYYLACIADVHYCDVKITCMVQVQWAGTPGQWTLKGVEEVPEDPGQDHVVEQTNKEGYSHGSHTCVYTFSLIHQEICVCYGWEWPQGNHTEVLQSVVLYSTFLFAYFLEWYLEWVR